jgi:acetolactate synthase I/II/III large subunit
LKSLGVTMRYNGAEIIIRLLEQTGITTVAGIPGGSNLPLYNALHKSMIRHILVRHEQAAGFIAQGMARSTGRPAVCFATSGPGATNLVTAIADAKLDSVPIIAITGQVATSMIGTDAFQEVDTYGMTLPITKHNFLVKSARELLSIIPRAFSIAVSGRPGPILIDVPKDVQLEEIEVESWPRPAVSLPRRQVDHGAIRKAAAMINRAKRPVIYGGGGIVASGHHESVKELALKNNIPVALTLMGLGSFPPDHPLYLGMLGMHGAPSTNMILNDTDLLVALGVRFDDRAVGMVTQFCPEASVLHIDVDEAELHKIKRADLGLCGDLGDVLTELIPLVDQNPRGPWMDRVSELRRSHEFFPVSAEEIHPIEIMKMVQSAFPADAIVCTDVGQHQMWVAQAFRFDRPRTLLTSGGLGTMGFGLPAAIGAALANPGRRVLCVSGDGSLQMNIQELATLAELNLPVTVLIMNNGHLGLVRQQQELFYNENYIACRFGVDLDFAALARQFGLTGHRVRRPRSLSAALHQALSLNGPSLIDLTIPHAENVLPMVPPGESNTEMIGVHGRKERGRRTRKA